jgi:hypothetical protein
MAAELGWTAEAGLVEVPAGRPVTAYVQSAAELVDGFLVACFRGAVGEEDICPVHDDPDLRTYPAGKILPIHPGGDMGRLWYDLAAAENQNHKGISVSGVLSALATAGVPTVAVVEQPWNSGRRFLGMLGDWWLVDAVA